MKTILLGLIGLTASYACFAEPMTNTTPSFNTHSPIYLGAGVTTGGFNNQYQIQNNDKITTGNKNNGMIASDIHIGWVNHAFRAELSLDYINSQRAYSEYDSLVKENLLKTANSSALATMLDGYYDLHVADQLTAFVGLGAGYMHTFASGTAASKKSHETAAANNFAYNAKLGMDYDLSDKLQAFASGELLRLTGNNPYMNEKDYFTTMSIGINYHL